MPKSALLVFVCLLGAFCSSARTQELPSFDYDVARSHELKPHRRAIPLKGVKEDVYAFHITLTISPSGDVVQAEVTDNGDSIQFWPIAKAEVLQWKFIPFEQNGKAVTAKIEEYLDLVPQERLPKSHVVPPVLRRDSKILITLERTCYMDDCPSYTVTLRNSCITFVGSSHVVANGRHTNHARPEDVRALAKKFIAADFYSMDAAYHASVTEYPAYVLSVEIDGRKKEVVDYVGSWVGMPAVITELEDAVDSFAHTERWIEGTEGLAAALQLEGYNFQTFEAQLLFKEALMRGQTATVREILAAGVHLKPIPAPTPKDPDADEISYEHVSWLTAAAEHSDTLLLLIASGVSKNDQDDKDLALINAARSGKLDAVRVLIAYGANPNADVSKLIVTENGVNLTFERPGAGSILIYAAESGNPDVLREILGYHPDLEMRDGEGKTAIFVAGNHRIGGKNGARVECVRLLAAAGADVNTHDQYGNTPLHEISLTDVEEELLKLGADVNARNNNGETPIFTNNDNHSIALFIAHGADLTIRNNKGQTLMEFAKESQGPAREEALRNAMLNATPH